ncbi:hypothetical protein M3Y97_00062400 [Aphelenchoides bicaudatus]|nr:hypothetical protein M3Y97_00062400 [Aphelenchoides bicaudatus]
MIHTIIHLVNNPSQLTSFGDQRYQDLLYKAQTFLGHKGIQIDWNQQVNDNSYLANLYLRTHPTKRLAFKLRNKMMLLEQMDGLAFIVTMTVQLNRKQKDTLLVQMY